MICDNCELEPATEKIRIDINLCKSCKQALNILYQKSLMEDDIYG